MQLPIFHLKLLNFALSMQSHETTPLADGNAHTSFKNSPKIGRWCRLQRTTPTALTKAGLSKIELYKKLCLKHNTKWGLPLTKIITEKTTGVRGQ